MTCGEKLAGMVDITEKPPLFRRATAQGTIRLRESTIKAIIAGNVKKGDVLTTARLAAILAVKDTPRLIPLCHPIPITGLDVFFDLEEVRVRATVTVTPVCSMSGIWSSIWRRMRPGTIRRRRWAIFGC
jgi:cyclic pyranopterin phosphate synthase